MGIVAKNVEKSMVRILYNNDFSTHYRNAGQIQFQEPDESVLISVVNSNINKYILDYTKSNTHFDRHTMSPRSTIYYRNLDSHLRCGSCGICTN